MTRRAERIPKVPAFLEAGIAARAAELHLAPKSVRGRARIEFQRSLRAHPDVAESARWTAALFSVGRRDRVAAKRTRRERARGLPDAEPVPDQKNLIDFDHRFPFRPGQFGGWNEDGLFHIRTAQADGESREVITQVIAGAVRPLRRVRVEERTYVEAEIGPGETVTLTVPDLLARLVRDGRIVYHERARDLVPAWVFHMLPNTETSWPTWGFFEDAGGRVVEARTPTPVLPEQVTAWEEVRGAVDRPLAAEDLAAYAKLIGFFHPREVLPVFGSAIAAPFAFLFRRRRLLVPQTYTWSKHPGLGKTSSAEAFSIGLFGREATTGGSLNSEFRLPAHQDAYCGPQAVNEAERLDWRRLGPDLKASAEGPLATRRGRSDLTMTEYASREVLLITSNAPPPLTGTELVRFLLIHMDEAAAADRRARAAEFEAALYDCRQLPIGPALSRRFLDSCPTVQELVRRRSRHAEEIRAAAGTLGVALGDPRRPGAWAVVYLGLEAFAGACTEFGIPWSLPTVHAFVAGVVAPVEEGVAEMEVKPVDRFRSFLDSWRVRNTSAGVVKGEGSVILTGTFELTAAGNEPRHIAGTYVTPSILEEYNAAQERAGRMELRVGSLKELSEISARSVGLPERAFLEVAGNLWKAPRITFGLELRQRAAFVPRDSDDLASFFGVKGPTLADDHHGSGTGDESAPALDERPGPMRVPFGPDGSGWERPGPGGSAAGPGEGPADSPTVERVSGSGSGPPDPKGGVFPEAGGENESPALGPAPSALQSEPPKSAPSDDREAALRSLAEKLLNFGDQPFEPALLKRDVLGLGHSLDSVVAAFDLAKDRGLTVERDGRWYAAGGDVPP